MKRASAIFFCSLFVCLLASATTVQAGGFALYEWGNRALGMGTANYATGNDASVIAYNPAQMTKLEGNQVYVGFTAITPGSDVVVNGQAGNTREQTFMVPHGYYAHKLNDDWSVGVGLFTRFGLGTEYNGDWPGRRLLTEAMLESVSLNPSVAYNITDNFTMAVGFEVVKGTFEFTKYHAAGVVNPLLADGKIDVSASGTSYAGNLGLYYEPTDNVSLGFAYRSPMHFVGKGDVNLGNTVGGVLDQSGNAEITADFPSSWTLGVGYNPIEDLTLEFDVIFTEWEHFDRMEMDFKDVNAAVLPDMNEDFYYKNAWRFQLGAEYQVLDWFAMRAGYVFDQTPTKHHYASMMLPANDRNMFTLGAGFSGEKWNVDVAGMYILTDPRYGVPMNDGVSKYTVDFKDGSTWGLGLSAGYSF